MNTNNDLDIYIRIRRTNTKLLFDSYPNGIVKNAIHQSLAARPGLLLPILEFS